MKSESAKIGRSNSRKNRKLGLA